MKNKILIPTDFSKNAWNALSYALQLFREDKCTFYLLHVFQLYDLTTDDILKPKPGESTYEEARERSERKLENLLGELKSRQENSKHNFETISLYGNIWEVVKETVQEKNLNMVVMGTKGESNPMNRIYGSNAVKIMEKVRNCPVIVVPENTGFNEKSTKEIVFATNYKNAYEIGDFDELLKMANRYKGAIRILYVQEGEKFTAEQEENKELLQVCLKNVVHTFHTLTNVKVTPGIHSFIESRGSDMLALNSKKHNFFNSLFSKSLVKEINYKPQVPILVIHNPK